MWRGEKSVQKNYNLRRYSSLKKVKHNSPPLKYEIHLVTPFQRVQHKRGAIERPGKHYLGQVINASHHHQC